MNNAEILAEINARVAKRSEMLKNEPIPDRIGFIHGVLAEAVYRIYWDNDFRGVCIAWAWNGASGVKVVPVEYPRNGDDDENAKEFMKRRNEVAVEIMDRIRSSKALVPSYAHSVFA